MEPEEPLLTAEEVAPLLNVKPATVYDAAWRGRIPCVRLWTGKRKSLLRFRRCDIEQFIRDHVVPVRGDPPKQHARKLAGEKATLTPRDGVRNE